jgi:predicted ATPase/DNA-binding CsgD family transcriptional regulator
MALTLLHQSAIPLPTTSLVGRDTELARVLAMVADPATRLVTLTGPGGVGKTRLALQVAHDIDPGVAGEVHLALLASATDTDAVLAAIVRALGIGQIEGIPAERRLIDAIGGRRILLILDNAEQVADQLTPLATILAHCPGLTILVTSRVMLRLSAEIVFPIEPLATTRQTSGALGPAAELFIARAQAVRPDLPLDPDEIGAIEEICRQVDGLPLAIELAAARSRFLSPTALHDRLRERLPLLVGGPRDAPERHQTLRATLTWSHDLLTDDERTLFRRLAIFRNGAPYDAVEPVTNATGDLPNVDELLAALIDHSLVRVAERPATGPRVRLLNTIREFALEQLDASGEAEALADAHAAWFASLVADQPEVTWRTGTDELRVWTLRHQPDAENLAVAIERVLDGDHPELTVRMANGLVPFWLELGEIRESRDLTTRVIPLAEHAPPDVRIRHLYLVAVMAMIWEAMDEALPHARNALALAEEIDDPRMIANSQNLVGTILWNLGDAEEGERLKRGAVEIIHRLGDPLGGAMFIAQIGEHFMDSGDQERAEQLIREALPDIVRHRPDAAPLFAGSLVPLLIRRDALDEAGEVLEMSLAYHRDPPHRQPYTMAERLADAARIAVRRGVPEQGGRLFGVALTIFDHSGLTQHPRLGSIVTTAETDLREALGEERLAAEVVAGRQMPIPQALDLALEIARVRSDTPGGDAPADRHGLTDRQLEILRLLAEGRSNPAIAEALFISERTVTTHLTRIYDRLNVSTRTEAIARATQLGLVGAHAAP